MQPFNIIDGLNEIFDDTCTNQVVSCLIRNPVIWKFLAEERNFLYIREALGEDPDRWTIKGVVESAAGISPSSRQTDLSRNSTDPAVFMADIASINELSALELKVKDYIAENSIGLWIKNLPYQTSSKSDHWYWAMILSLIFQEFDYPLDALEAFISDKQGTAIKLLAYAVHSDPSISDQLLNNLSGLCATNGIRWLVDLINFLDFLGDVKLSKELAEIYLSTDRPEKSLIQKSGVPIDDLLKKIAENRNLTFIAQKAENKKLLANFQNEGKELLTELLNRSGLSNYDPTIFEGYQGLPNDDINHDSLNAKLLEKIEEASSIREVDPNSAQSIAKNIYKITLDEISKNDANQGFGYSLRHKIIDLLNTCNLIVECANLTEVLLSSYPNDVRLLRIAAALFHRHGDHQKAIRYFQILNVLDSLSREEKIQYANSSAYLGKFINAYKVRSTVNTLDFEDIRILLVYAFYAGLQEEMGKILDQYSNKLHEWPLYLLFSKGIDKNENLVAQDWNNIWSTLTNNWDKVLFIDFLEKTNYRTLVPELLDESIKNSSEFSGLFIKQIKNYQRSGDTSALSDKLNSVQLNRPINQKDFEEGINLFIQNGFIGKASQWFKRFEKEWQLSPVKKLIHAEILLFEQDFGRAEQLLDEEIHNVAINEKLLLIYSLALLNSNPDRFPIGICPEKIFRIKEIKEKFEQELDYTDTKLRILRIYLNDQDRIGLFEKELANNNNNNEDDVWRIKAAIANEYFNQGRFDLAIQYFKEVERIHPFDLTLLRNLLECYLRLKLAEEAEVILHRLLAIEGLNWKDLLNLSFDHFLSKEWISFLNSQMARYPDSKEIHLLFSLSSLRYENFADAVESIKHFLTNPELSTEEYLIAAQILAASGDRIFAERILEVLLSGNKKFTSSHYLTFCLIYQSLGEYSKALVMLNHIQHFNRLISAIKLDLLIKNGNTAEAASFLKDLKPDPDFAFYISRDLPLIDAAFWLNSFDDPSFFEKTAANVWLVNQDLSSALNILEEGFRHNGSDEQMAYLLLETAKLSNRSEILDNVLSNFEGKEILSDELTCSLAESALMLGQEVLAAQYLSAIVGSNENKARIKGLQSRLLRRNGNVGEAKYIYRSLVNVSNLKEDSPDLLWWASLTLEMEDYSYALEITHKAIAYYGMAAGLVNTYLKAIAGLQRQNVLYEKLNRSSQIQDLSGEQLTLFREVEGEFSNQNSAKFDLQVFHVCKAYIDQEFYNFDKFLNQEFESIDQRDILHISTLLYGHEKTFLEFSTKITNRENLIFYSAILSDDHFEKSLELIKDYANFLSNDPIVLALLAKIHYKIANYSEAYAAITLALNIIPEEYGWEMLAGEISQKRSDPITAIEHFERARALSKNTVHFEQLHDLHLLTESEQAIPILEDQFADEPRNSDLALKIASLCANFNKLAKAAHYYEIGLQLNPKDHQPYLGLSKLSAQIGNLEKAMEYADKGLYLSERDFDLLQLKSELIKKTRSPQEAMEFLENQVLLNDEINSDLQALLADLIYELNGLDECLEFIASRNHFQSQSVKFSTTNVKYLLIAGDTNHAKEILEKTLGENPDNAEVNALMGEYFGIQGDLDQAIGHYLRAINLDSKNEKYFIDLFEIYNLQRDSESAVEALKSGIMSIPYSVDLPVRLAKHFFQYGLDEKANEMIERVLRLRPHEAEALALNDLILHRRLTIKNEIEIPTE